MLNGNNLIITLIFVLIFIVSKQWVAIREKRAHCNNAIKRQNIKTSLSESTKSESLLLSFFPRHCQNVNVNLKSDLNLIYKLCRRCHGYSPFVKNYKTIFEVKVWPDLKFIYFVKILCYQLLRKHYKKGLRVFWTNISQISYPNIPRLKESN